MLGKNAMAFSVDKVALATEETGTRLLGGWFEVDITSLTRSPNRGLPAMAENTIRRVPYSSCLDSSGAMLSIVKFPVAAGLLYRQEAGTAESGDLLVTWRAMAESVRDGWWQLR